MPKKLNIIFDAQNDAQNSVSRMAAAVSSGISSELTLPSAWLVVLPLESICMASACAEGYVVCIMLGMGELRREVAAACHPGGCVCLGDMAGLEDERLKEQG